ncbi:hypothetical protein SAY87_017660 [Trapa incisa]|uniref:VQ domain-containing protein n=1 Tax=Trapa incisa TaxID=236973 RepID=A0AAN7L6X3_9MYRT|nr:hypothetical protein SAY87_017660 [Trapa incisa]
MVSSDMAILEPWSFRPSSIDLWFSEALSRETQTLTRALSQSISGGNSASDFFSGVASDPFSSLFDSLPKPEPPPTPAVSNVSGGSGPVPSPKRRQRSGVPASAASGKVSKRKPRPSKRSHTTFITADPANFRQMVQRLTGVRFDGCQQLHVARDAILRPEPQRPRTTRFSACAIPAECLPTLDTSSFLLNQHQHQIHVSATSATPPSNGVSAAGGFDYDSVPSFPTLESWNDI